MGATEDDDIASDTESVLEIPTVIHPVSISEKSVDINLPKRYENIYPQLLNVTGWWCLLDFCIDKGYGVRVIVEGCPWYCREGEPKKSSVLDLNLFNTHLFLK